MASYGSCVLAHRGEISHAAMAKPKLFHRATIAGARKVSGSVSLLNCKPKLTRMASLIGLGRVCKLQPEQNRGDREHGEVVLGAFLIARGDPPELLEAVDQPLDAITQAVDRAIEYSGAALVAFAWDGVANVPPPQVGADLVTTVAFITDHPLGSLAWPSTSRPLDGTLLHQLFEDDGFVPLADGQDKGQGLATAFGPHVDLGAETALTPPKCFGLRRRRSCASRVLMGADDRGIDVMGLPIELPCRISVLLERFPDPLPDALLGPAVEATGNRRPLTVAFGQVAPGSAGALDSQDPIQDLAMIQIGLASLRFLGWEQGCQALPPAVR